jgi:hypothetical protein
MKGTDPFSSVRMLLKKRTNTSTMRVSAGAQMSISHTIRVEGTKHECVDIEIITGKAFTE